MGAGLTHLSALTGLTRLNVGYTSAGDNALMAWSTLTNLRSLNLDSCSISDRCGTLSSFLISMQSNIDFAQMPQNRLRHLCPHRGLIIDHFKLRRHPGIAVHFSPLLYSLLIDFGSAGRSITAPFLEIGCLPVKESSV